MVRIVLNLNFGGREGVVENRPLPFPKQKYYLKDKTTLRNSLVKIKKGQSRGCFCEKLGQNKPQSKWGWLTQEMCCE